MLVVIMSKKWGKMCTTNVGQILQSRADVEKYGRNFEGYRCRESRAADVAK